MPESKRKRGSNPERVRHNVRVTSDDVPGDGMAKKAAKAIEENRRKRKEILDNL